MHKTINCPESKTGNPEGSGGQAIDKTSTTEVPRIRTRGQIRGPPGEAGEADFTAGSARPGVALLGLG